MRAKHLGRFMGLQEERLKGKPNFAVPLVPQDEEDVQKVGKGGPRHFWCLVGLNILPYPSCST